MREPVEQSMTRHLESLRMDLRPWEWQLHRNIQDRLPMLDWEVGTDWQQVERSECCIRDGGQLSWKTLFGRGTSGGGT